MFIGKNVILRGFELEDTTTILAHFNDMEVRRFLDNPIPHSQEDEKEWIRATWQARKDGRGHFFAIELKKTHKLIGGCGLFGINPKNHFAELMIVIYDMRNWGQGYGTEALKLLLDFGYHQLNLHRIYLYTHDNNIRAQRVYEKLGFQPTGRRRQASYFEGSYHDLIHYDLLVEEYNLRMTNNAP